MRSHQKFALNAQHSRDGEKKCSKCRRWGPLEDFPPNPNLSSGLSSWCRECHRNSVRDWRRRNRERENARRRVGAKERRAA
jgi:hypothetical protein